MRIRLLALGAAAPLLMGVLSASCRPASPGGAAASGTAPGPALTGQASPAATQPCGRVRRAPRYTHVVWIWMENHSYGSIIGSRAAPFINRLAARCGLATNYHNITHPSLPNYVAATSGLGYARLRRFKPDCRPARGCTTAARSVFGQGETWRAYQESMPSACYRTSHGQYAVRHNPPPYFATLPGCARFDVPYSHLARDLATRKLPAFSFITPNLTHDMHDGRVTDGDRWLARHLPAILRSPQYLRRSTVVIITWDEGEGGPASKCATNQTDVGCHVATIVVSPSTRPGTRSARLFNHYSLLGTTEQLLHLRRLGLASSAATMTATFNL